MDSYAFCCVTLSPSQTDGTLITEEVRALNLCTHNCHGSRKFNLIVKASKSSGTASVLNVSYLNIVPENKRAADTLGNIDKEAQPTAREAVDQTRGNARVTQI